MTTSFDSLPEFLSSHDLVALGLFSSPDAAYIGQVRGHSPEFLRIGKKILYPKTSVLRFIEDRLTSGPSRHTNNTQST